MPKQHRYIFKARQDQRRIAAALLRSMHAHLLQLQRELVSGRRRGDPALGGQARRGRVRLAPGPVRLGRRHRRRDRQHTQGAPRVRVLLADADTSHAMVA